MDNYKSPAVVKRQSVYKQNRYKLSWIDAVHYNNNGKKACNIIVLDPKHSTVKSEVTCRCCIKNMGKL